VYLKGYKRVSEVRAGISAYLSFYNEERPHQALRYQTPQEVFERRGPSAGEADDTEEIDCNHNR
jgi:transposase InsO family protein